MTPTIWIWLVHVLGTAAATYYLVYDYGESALDKERIEKYSGIFTKQFLTSLFIVMAFLASFFLWPFILLRGLIDWIRFLVVMWTARNIVDAVTGHKAGKITFFKFILNRLKRKV